jgi:peptidoglycan hydrolase-like protein with peptidoglycan-binding domain
MTIKDIQLALVGKGFDPKGIDGIAGAHTYDAVEDFQKANDLQSDGILRWETLKALLPAVSWAPTLADRAIQIESLMIGVREEEGENAGVMVDAFQRATGNRPGDSWCVSFQVWVYDQAADGLGIPNPLPRTGGVLDLLHRTKSQVIAAADYSDPRPGDLGIIDEGNGHGHMYMVSGLGQPGYVDSFEGNTNPGGSSDGFGAFARVRSIAKTKAFIRVA